MNSPSTADPFEYPWQQLLCTNWSATSSSFDSLNKKLAVKVSTAEPSRKASGDVDTLTFYSPRKPGKDTFLLFVFNFYMGTICMK